MNDPTREEMLAFLRSQFDEECADDFEVAMFWYAMYWHGGQGSNLYEVLSTSPFSPGPCGRLEDEGDMVAMCYEALEHEFSGKHTEADVRALIQRGPHEPEASGEIDPVRNGEIT